MKRGVALLAAAALLGCASAFDVTYAEETNRQEAQQQAQDAQQQAAHAEASKYAAVVYFEVGNSVVNEDGYRELGWFVDKIKPYPQAEIQVQGFADATGGDARNQNLSADRARAVADFLQSSGIGGQRLHVQGFGKAFAADSNQSSAGRTNNRRVEVTVR